MIHWLFPSVTPHPSRMNPFNLSDFVNGMSFMSLGTMFWVGVGSLVVGAAGSVMSADSSRKAAHTAADANKANVAATNATDYQRWLESQGVGPDGNPVNTKLPRWMTAASGSFGTPSVRSPTFSMNPTSPAIGALGGVPSASSSNALVAPRPKFTVFRSGIAPGTAPDPAVAASSGGGGSSTSSKLKTAGAVVGSLFGDPLPGLLKIFG